MPEALGLLPVVPVVAGAVLMLVDRRDVLLFALLVLYAVLTAHTTGSLGIRIALVKLLGGSMVVAVLWLSVRSLPREELERGGGLLTKMSFRAVSLLLVLTAGVGTARADWLNVPAIEGSSALSASLMLSLGLLQLALFQRPFRVGLGMLTVLTGFEIFYSAIEPSLAMVALLVAVHIGLALITAYLTLRWHAGTSQEAGAE